MTDTTTPLTREQILENLDNTMEDPGGRPTDENAMRECAEVMIRNHAVRIARETGCSIEAAATIAGFAELTGTVFAKAEYTNDLLYRIEQKGQ